MLYKQAGVDIDSLNVARKRMAKQIAKTFQRGKKSATGLFGGIYPFGNDYLISSVDSVGTKILIACGMGIHNTVGMDLVNHCVNDILTTGAIPLFFLDYIGFSELDKKILVKIVEGVATACRKEKMILVGGETAQLAKFYPKGIYDLAGFIVGRVHRKDFVDTTKVRPGDLVLGLRSSGLHTNGYSLARKILLRKYGFQSYIPQLRCTIGEELLKVHRSYRKNLEPRLRYVKGLAHITGGGFYDNIRRILPKGTSAVIQKNSWKPLPVFTLIQELGDVPDEEMYRVFNMGIGMVVIIHKNNIRYFKPLRPKIIGEIVKGNFGVKLE